MYSLMLKILNCVQTRNRVPKKPANLPIKSLAEMATFENIDEDTYTEVVSEKKIIYVILARNYT